jgi:O-antigen/teichoic acid export membrane protein
MKFRITTLSLSSRNVLANLVGAGAVSSLSLLFNYAYYHLMGAESYGLITYYLMLTTFAGMFDFSLSRTTLRELARRSVTAELSRTIRSTLTTVQLLQGSVFLLIGGLIALLAPMIASVWLKSQTPC